LLSLFDTNVHSETAISLVESKVTSTLFLYSPSSTVLSSYWVEAPDVYEGSLIGPTFITLVPPPATAAGALARAYPVLLNPIQKLAVVKVALSDDS